MSEQPKVSFLLPVQIQDWEHSHEVWSIVDHIEYRRYTFSVTMTHSSITLTNLSFINLVTIFRRSSSPRNPVYTRRVDPSVLGFSLLSHRHSFIILFFNSHFIDS
jgi:hypothetical protein